MDDWSYYLSIWIQSSIFMRKKYKNFSKQTKKERVRFSIKGFFISPCIYGVLASSIKMNFKRNKTLSRVIFLYKDHPSSITVAEKSNGCDCINLSKFNNNIPRYLFLHLICIKWDRIQEYRNPYVLPVFCQLLL